MIEDYSELIIRYLQNDLSPSEKNIFFLWIESSEENKKTFFEIKAMHETCFFIEKGEKEIENSWERLLIKRRKNKTHYYLRWRTIASYAAVILLTAATVSSFFIFNNTKEINITTSTYIGSNGVEADSFVLPDGSKIYLGAKTKFHYNSDYAQSKRDVFLEGEAYFEVSHMKDKPFVVHINGIEIEALGTAFNVMAYPDDSLMIATLTEGSIVIEGEHIFEKTVIKPNQQLIYNRNSHITRVHDVEANDFISWTDGYYSFSDQTLEYILNRLESVYGVIFDIQSERLKELTFTGTFYRGQNAKDIMEIIQTSVPIKYKIDKQYVLIFE